MWYSLYSVGDIEIDEQHLNIDYMLTQLASDGDKAWGQLEAVVRAMDQHFAFEEQVSERRGYNMTPQHRSRHDELREELKKLLLLVEQHPDELPAVLRRLEDILVSHIRDFDRYLVTETT